MKKIIITSAILWVSILNFSLAQSDLTKIENSDPTLQKIVVDFKNIYSDVHDEELRLDDIILK